MKTIHLHGSLARFGGPFCLDVRDAAEAVRALTVQIPGLREAIEAGNWHVVRGPLDGGESLSEDALRLGLPDDSEIHLLPAIEGAGNGWANVIVGAILVVAGYFTFGATSGIGMAMIAGGAGLAIGGIVQLTTSTPESDYGSREEANKRPSFLFDGAANTSTQGLPVPVIYGRIKTGSVVISAGLSSEEV